MIPRSLSNKKLFERLAKLQMGIFEVFPLAEISLSLKPVRLVRDNWGVECLTIKVTILKLEGTFVVSEVVEGERLRERGENVVFWRELQRDLVRKLGREIMDWHNSDEEMCPCGCTELPIKGEEVHAGYDGPPVCPQCKRT